MPDEQPSWRKHQPPWPHSDSEPPWMRMRPDRRQFLFSRFIAFLVFLAVIFTVIFLIAYALISLLNLPPEPRLHPRSPVFILAACVTPLIFLAALFFFASLAFNRFGTPLVSIMEAVDAVAEGDFSVRVREDLQGNTYRRLAKRFNRMVEELDKAAQQRKNLTNDVAHELRNPLHIIQGNLEGIIDGVYQPTTEHISATLEETRLLARLVEDLQVLSLAEAGQLPLHKQKFPVADLLADVAASFEGQAAEAGLSLKVDLPDDTSPLELDADYDRLDQVLSNLVANAIRYTPPGGSISLSGGILDGQVRLVIEDTGSGIPAEDLPYIFERFWKGDRARTHQAGGGSGLGLAIARQLIEAHGGKIQAESLPGRGTRFLIDLPAVNPAV